jgi:hypothetical protein
MSNSGNSKEITQADVDQFHPVAIASWEKMLQASGKTELLFKISHEAMQFMAHYQQTKEDLEADGFVVPELFKGTKINICK